MAKKTDYFGLSYVVSLVLAIIPITAWVCGIVTRIQEKKYVAVVVRVLFGWFIWILDIVFMIKDKSICRLIEM